MKPLRAEEVEGWMTEEELRVLREVASALKKPFVVEVGSWKGRSTIALAQAIAPQGGKFFAVDTWQGTPSERTTYHAEARYRDIYKQFCNNISAAAVDGVVVSCKMTSLEAANLFLGGSVDMVFLDGDHSQEAVTADIEAWWPKLKKGGLMMGHDYTDQDQEQDQESGGWPGVKRAVQAKFGPSVAVINGTTLWMVRKETDK